jgi:DnaA-homolog protein
VQLSLPFTRSRQVGFGEFVEAPGTDAIRTLRADSPAQVLLVGPRGSGKSHLLASACQQCDQSGQRAAYVPLVDAHQFAPEILVGLNTFDLVCIDDVHAVAGDPIWEDALFHCYNECDASAARVVFSANAPAHEIGLQLPDLVSRLHAALMVRSEPLDDDHAVEALKRRADFDGFDMPESVAKYLLRRLPRDMPTLIRVLDQLGEHSLAEKRKLTVPAARVWLASE